MILLISLTILAPLADLPFFIIVHAQINVAFIITRIATLLIIIIVVVLIFIIIIVIVFPRIPTEKFTAALVEVIIVTIWPQIDKVWLIISMLVRLERH